MTDNKKDQESMEKCLMDDKFDHMDSRPDFGKEDPLKNPYLSDRLRKQVEKGRETRKKRGLFRR